jgi:Uma2 family endonuclease
MASTDVSTVQQGLSAAASEPLLEPGDRLSRHEFERCFDRMPQLKKAELIEGIVYMPSPVRVKGHSRPHSFLAVWLGHYAVETPGVEILDNATVRLDLDNEPQPDSALIKTPANGGRTRISDDDYLEGPPELVAEIVGSSRAYDLHQKKAVYRRHGVLEYLVWITGENRLLWWQLQQDEYREIAASDEGRIKSGIFPGLWLDSPALLRGDMKAVLEVLRRGMENSEYQTFVVT